MKKVQHRLLPVVSRERKMAVNIENGDPETQLQEITASLSQALPCDEEQQLQIVSFVANDREFGLHILHVREVVRVPVLTRVPNAPKQLAGVINLRGSVLPVITLQKPSSNGTRAEDAKNAVPAAIVVVDPDGKAVGVLADSAPEVLTIPATAVSSPPRTGCTDPEYVFGMVRLGARLLILLDPERVIAAATA